MFISPLIDPFALHNIVEDTSPQLGGDLDVNGHEIKLAGQDYIGWWSGGNRSSYIRCSDAAANDLHIYGDDTIFLESDLGIIALRSSSAINFSMHGDTDDYIQFKTIGSTPEITTLGDCNLKVSPSGGLLELVGKLAISNQSRCCVVREGSTQAIPSGEWTKVQLNTEKFDQLSEFDSSVNYRFTASEAGYYVVCFSAGLRPGIGVGKKVIVQLKLNNTSPMAMTMLHSSVNDYIGGGNSIVTYLSANDYLELWVYHNSGADVNIDYTNKLTFLAIERLS